MKITLSRSSIQEPSASAAIVACGTLGLSAKRKSSRRLICGKRASIRRRRLATLGAFGHLGLEQRAEVGDRGLLLAEWPRRRARGSGGGRSGASARSRAPRSAPPGRRSARCGRGAVIGILRAAGRSRRGPARAARAPRAAASRPVSGAGAVGARLRAAGEDRDRAAVDRAGGQRAADGELDLGRGRARGRAARRRPSAGRRPSARNGRSARPRARRSRRARRRGRVPGPARRSAPGRRACAASSSR